MNFLKNLIFEDKTHTIKSKLLKKLIKAADLGHVVDGRKWKPGEYEAYLKKLAKENTILETKLIDLKPGQKKIIPTSINIKLSADAKAALKQDPKTIEQANLIKLELKKYEEEFKKLNALLNNARQKRDQLLIKKRKLNNSITSIQAKYFSLIEKECSEFLAEVKKSEYFLFRGSNDSANVFYGKSHIDREPADTRKKIQVKLDSILSGAGFKALRSNSIFTTSNIEQASDFGEIYIIFPKNGYNFTWSLKHDDWVPNENIFGKKQKYLSWEDVQIDLEQIFDDFF